MRDEPPVPPTPAVLTQRQLEIRWACSRMTLRRMMRRGELPCLRLGRGLRFPLAQVQAIESGRPAAP